MPLISVIVTAHNRKKYLLEAVNSVLNQTLPREDYEIIVVKNFKDYDDYLKEKGVKTIIVGDQGQGMDCISGLNIAEGEIISFLDDDDLFLPKKLEKIKKIFQDDDVGYYHNAYEKFLEKTPKNLNINLKKDYNYTVINNEEKQKKLSFMHSYNNLYNSSSISVRKDLLKNNYDYLGKINHTVDTFIFYLSLISNKKMIFDPEVLTLYRVHTYNTSFPINNDFNKWLEHKRSYIEKVIEDNIVISNMIKSSSFENIIINNILELKLELARLSYSRNDSKYKVTFRDFITFSKNDKSIRSILSNLSIYMPYFIKIKLVKKWYEVEQLNLKEEANHYVT
jgi:glycosyltransferase involved in cell wall biosynthesis